MHVIFKQNLLSIQNILFGQLSILVKQYVIDSRWHSTFLRKKHKCTFYFEPSRRSLWENQIEWERLPYKIWHFCLYFAKEQLLARKNYSWANCCIKIIWTLAKWKFRWKFGWEITNTRAVSHWDRIQRDSVIRFWRKFFISFSRISYHSVNCLLTHPVEDKSGKTKLQVRRCSTTGKPTRSFATEHVSLDSV